MAQIEVFMNKFVLKHTDIDVAFFNIDTYGNIEKLTIINRAHMPFLGTDDPQRFMFWWKHRAVPRKRPDLPELLKEAGCSTAELLLVKNLALSLTDTYWICPDGMDLRWRDVNLFENMEKISFNSPDGSHFSNDPSGSLGGNLEKKWIRHEDNAWYIHKYCETLDGQQAANELFATILHQGQPAIKGNFTPYEVHLNKFNVCDYCASRAFTDLNLELVYGYEVMEAIKKPNDVSYYEHFILSCERNGLDRDYVRSFMDYQTLTDYLMTNTDRHFMNFGVLRDPQTLRFMCMAPIYDSGNSMFYKDAGVLTRERLIESIAVNSFTQEEVNMLRYVRNKAILDLSLIPDPEFVKEFYIAKGIDEHKAESITRNYRTKTDILADFQKGLKIKKYHEKSGQRKQK